MAEHHFVHRDEHDEAFTAVNSRLDEHASRFTSIDERIVRLSETQSNDSRRLERMESHVDMFLREVGNIRADFSRWAQDVGTRLQNLVYLVVILTLAVGIMSTLVLILMKMVSA